MIKETQPVKFGGLVFRHKFRISILMHEKNYTGLIPANEEGREITAEHSVMLNDTAAASALYEQAKQRLLHVWDWKALSGKLSAAFYLTDEKGNDVERHISKGDHFKIDITGPGNKAGEGYDWVRVEDVREVHEAEIDSIAITVRPATNPQTPGSDTAHFYSARSTSTFVVTREGNRVSASIYDRNIKANKESNEAVVDKIRNTLVGLGAKEAFSKLQWQSLAEALLEP